MIWLRYMGASIEEQRRMHRFGSYPLINVRDSSDAMQRPGPRWIGRYVATERKAWSVTTQLPTHSRIGRYVGWSLRGSVATYRPTKWLGWSLRSDRLVRGPVVTLRPCLNPFPTFYARVLGLWMFSIDESTETCARFHRKVFRKDFFTKISFR